MKHKPTNDFTDEEKKIVDTIAINYVIAQSDGFQLGYAQALADFTESIIDYWKNSDDEPQQSILDILVDLGVELGTRKQTAKKNIEVAEKNGYEKYYRWELKIKDKQYSTVVGLYTLAEEDETEEDEK